MKIATKYFGEVEVKDNECIEFPAGLPGFESYHSFVLIPVDEQGTFLALQSVEEATLSLIVTNPYYFYKSYEFDIDPEEIGVHSPEEIAVYNVITLQDPFVQSTLNLQAPIVMNVKKRRAKQMILNHPQYKTKHSLISTEEGGESNARP